jgi:hypothetical protein
VTTLTQIFSVPTYGPAAPAGCLCNYCTVFIICCDSLAIFRPPHPAASREKDRHMKKEKGISESQKSLILWHRLFTRHQT